MILLLFNSWSSYNGRVCGPKNICIWNSLKFYENWLIILNMIKLDLHAAAPQVPNLQLLLATLWRDSSLYQYFVICIIYFKRYISVIRKRKIKFSLFLAWSRIREIRGMALFMFNLGSRWISMVNITPRPLYIPLSYPLPEKNPDIHWIEAEWLLSRDEL
jgi:hypothetical protein